MDANVQVVLLGHLAQLDTCRSAIQTALRGCPQDEQVQWLRRQVCTDMAEFRQTVEALVEQYLTTSLAQSGPEPTRFKEGSGEQVVVQSALTVSDIGDKVNAILTGWEVHIRQLSDSIKLETLERQSDARRARLEPSIHLFSSPHKLSGLSHVISSAELYASRVQPRQHQGVRQDEPVLTAERGQVLGSGPAAAIPTHVSGTVQEDQSAAMFPSLKEKDLPVSTTTHAFDSSTVTAPAHPAAVKSEDSQATSRGSSVAMDGDAQPPPPQVSTAQQQQQAPFASVTIQAARNVGLGMFAHVEYRLIGTTVMGQAFEVNRRFSDFSLMLEALLHRVPSLADVLPQLSKKVLGRLRSKTFLATRQEQLQQTMDTLVEMQAIHPIIARFFYKFFS